MLGIFPPGGLSSHLLLHLGVSYPARKIRYTKNLAKIEIALGGNRQQILRLEFKCRCILIYLLNCDKFCYLRQVFLYQLLVLEHYLGVDHTVHWWPFDNNPVPFSTCCLARGVVLDQVEKADFADSTARSIS